MCIDNRTGFSFSLQDVVALTVESILCMFTALSAHGEFNFSLFPFFPPHANVVGVLEKCTPVVLSCRKAMNQFHVGDFPGIAVFSS